MRPCGRATTGSPVNLFEKLFFTSTRNELAVDSDTAGSQPAATSSPALITIQALATFPGASLVITVVWKFSDAILDIQSRWVPIGTSFLVAAALYAMTPRGTMSASIKVVAAEWHVPRPVSAWH